MRKFLVTVLLLGAIGAYFIYAISQNLQSQNNPLDEHYAATAKVLGDLMQLERY
mgnify:CR=1 FL=1